MRSWIFFTGILLLLLSCNKAEFLDKKPQTSLLVPTQLKDFEKLLDGNDMSVSGILGEISAGDFYFPDDESWEAIPNQEERNAYIWAKRIYAGQESLTDWSTLYKQVLYANITLEGLDKLKPSADEQYDFDRIKGWALFIRGHAFYNLAQTYAPVYDKDKAALQSGIPLRLESDVTVRSTRASVQATYKQLLADLEQATTLLPEKIPGTDRNRPYKAAAKALLARVYLNMREYDKAYEYAEDVLKTQHTLLDYATISTASFTPFNINTNTEVLYSCKHYVSASLSIYSLLLASNTLVDSTLYKMYGTNDLRKSILFGLSFVHEKPGIKGSYEGNLQPFTGLAIDETILIKAECQIRSGNYGDGITTLNDLLKTRWKKDTYVPYTANNQDEALRIVLDERRKELPFRGIRWQDLRRLNAGGANITLKRLVKGVEYELTPNSPRYTMPIPDTEILLSGLEQNAR
ncbi:RagB/SusD family nutrient uptake outer membrane protein [Chitinophaga niabensis]|uniref:SusD family protein n=1 Tax=Chitinophaga niabensis TaxID=536979 RepID=A0A1N6H2U0_9BACT|nr:RagB/SusD family nutrient uptake outer membrane protein [Chitinophaga niabensis]SIO14138.1 SusD family protein [Chitinophaga niabensis]